MDAIQDQQVWNIFEMPPEDIATVYKQDLQIQTEPSDLSDGAFRQSQSGTIRLLTRDLDSWLLPSQARLQVRFRIVNGAGAGANYTDAEAITLINGGWNIFKDVEIRLNGKVIDRIDQPGKVQLMHGYASYSAEYVKQCQDMEWFYPESANFVNGQLDGTGSQLVGSRQLTGFACAIDRTNEWGGGAGITADEASALTAGNLKRNDSFARRYKRTRAGRRAEIWLPLSAVSGFCKDNTKVIRGMTMEVALNRNTQFTSILHGQLNLLDSSIAEGAAAVYGTPTLIVDSVSMWLPELKPSLAMASHIEQQLANDAATKWVFSEMTAYQSDTYQNNTPQLRWQIVSTAHRPTLALVGFQCDTQYNAVADRSLIMAATAVLNTARYPVDPATRLVARNQHASSNGGLFSALGDITSVEFRVNGKIVPNESYQISFLNETYKRAYYDFRRVFHKDDPTEHGIYDEFTYWDSPIFAFDLRAIGDEGIYQNIKTNNLEFRATLTSSVDGVLANGAYGSGAFQVFCVLVSEKEASVEAKGGRLSIMP